MFRKTLLVAGMLFASMGVAHAADITASTGTASIIIPSGGTSYHAGGSITFTSFHSIEAHRTDSPFTGSAQGLYTFINGAGFVPGNIYIIVTTATGVFSWASGNGASQNAPSSGTMSISGSHTFTLSPPAWDSFAKTKWHQTTPNGDPEYNVATSYSTFKIIP
ncbi:MAG: hypothetical protein NT023_12465 [Armatimonadetes bacterium]|nr:hypothetical protein [Armatimonadota bacterium]